MRKSKSLFSLSAFGLLQVLFEEPSREGAGKPNVARRVPNAVSQDRVKKSGLGPERQ